MTAAVSGSGDPVPPQDVRAVSADREVPVELVYVGADEHGLHLWAAVLELGARPIGLRAAELPARTAITVRWIEPPGEVSGGGPAGR